MRLSLSAVLILACAASAQSRLPRALLLGDSVYNQHARAAAQMLKDRVELVVPKTRVTDTTRTLQRLDALLGEAKWDLIHFNFGLADLHYRDPRSESIRALSKHAGGVRVTAPERYEENLDAIVTRLKKSGAKLLWASTTPIDKSKFDNIYDPGSAAEYNAIAARVMQRHGVAINDMHAYVRSILPERRDPSPFSFDRKALDPPIVRRILEELDLMRPVKGPVRVFVMVGGWSHIGGGVVLGADKPRAGAKGTLDHLVLDPKTAKRYRYLLEADGRWVTRPDVWIQFDRRFPSSGTLGIRYGGDRKRCIGSELTLGHALGDHFEEQVLVLKTALGTPSLDKDLCPPSAGKAGRSYQNLVQQVATSLRHLRDRFPDYTDASGYEIAGLILNLGEQDADAKRYAALLPQLIKDLRSEWRKPDLPVVIAGTGKGGREKPTHPEILAAQRAVAELPNWNGTVQFVDTRDFWPPADAREAFRYPSFDRWFDNAESFCRMGRAIGAAMVRMHD